MAVIDLSIVLPCYNESGNIPHILKRFQDIIPTHITTEILLVNNGSTDDSAQVFKTELAKLSNNPFKVVEIETNQGYGHGILTGLEQAKGNVLAWTHADMQTDPKDVFTAYEHLLEDKHPFTIIKGRRLNRPWLEAFFTGGMQVIVNFLLQTKLSDINAQPKVFYREFYTTHLKNTAPLDFSLDLYALYQAKNNGKIATIPVYFNKRMAGEAKGGGSFKTRLKLIRRTFSYIWDLRNRLKLENRN